MSETKENLNLDCVNNLLTCRSEPKMTFINEFWVGKVCIPVKTELDLTGVHESQHDKIIELAQKLYFKDRQVHGC